MDSLCANPPKETLETSTRINVEESGTQGEKASDAYCKGCQEQAIPQNAVIAMDTGSLVLWKTARHTTSDLEQRKEHSGSRWSGLEDFPTENKSGQTT